MKAVSVIAVTLLSFAGVAPSVFADGSPTHVGGYLCDGKQEQVAFLARQAAGDNEIMAADAVNKATGRASCADYVSVDVIPVDETVVMAHGLVFKTHRVLLLPERAERWTGSVMSALDQVAQKQDI